jgi:hypothetical protein
MALFLSSYAPLWAVLAYRNRDARLAWIILGATALLSVVVLLALMRTYRGATGPPLTVRHAKPRDTEVLSYIASYLIPFFSLDLSKPDDAITLVVFLAVLCVVYINSSMLLVNPILSFCGYRAWDVTDSDGHEYMLVTRRTPAPSQVLEPLKVGDYLRVEV